MTSPTDPAPDAGFTLPDAGFTLIEVLVVVLLLGLVAGLVLQRGPVRSPAVGLRAAAGDLGRTLRLARTRAITANRPVTVRLDGPGRAYGIAGEAGRTLPASFAVTLVTLVPGASSGTGIAFAPDGSSSGGRIGLAEGGRAIEVDVDWLTGRVTVSPLGAAGAR